MPDPEMESELDSGNLAWDAELDQDTQDNYAYDDDRDDDRGEDDASQEPSRETPPRHVGPTEAQINRAAQLGISKEHAARLGDDLEPMLASMEQTLYQRGGSSQTPPEKPAEQPQKTREELEAEMLAELSYKFGDDLDLDDFDPAVRSVVEGINSHYARQLAQMQQLLQPLQQFVQHSISAQEAQQLDQLFGSLDNDYVELVGNEPIADLANDDPRVKMRQEVVEQMEVIATVRHQRGMQPLSPKQLFEDALRMSLDSRLPQHTKKARAAAAQKQLRDDKGKFSRPAAGISAKDTSSGEARAIKSIDAILRS